MDISKNEYAIQLNNNGVIAFVPTGNSMWPFLKNRNQSVIVEKKTERLKLYDVALYLRKDGKIILHRIVKVLNNGYIIQGDSQFYQETIEEDYVIGKMISFYRGKKSISCDDKKYNETVIKWVNSRYKKKILCKFFFFRAKYKHRFIKLFKIIFRKNKKENEDV